MSTDDNATANARETWEDELDLDDMAKDATRLALESDEPQVAALGAIAQRLQGLRDESRDIWCALTDIQRCLTTDAPKAEPGKAATKTQARKAKHVTAAARVAEYLAAHPGAGTRDIRSALRRAMGTCPDKLALDAVALLVEAGAIVAPDVARGQARPHWLVGPKVPTDVLAHVSLKHRPAVSVAAPPPSGCSERWRGKAERTTCQVSSASPPPEAK